MSEPPGTIDREALWARKVAALGAPHVAALERYRAALAEVHGVVPHFDPEDGGGEAGVLLLLETPGPRMGTVRIVSRDNATGTARNIARLSAAAGLSRTRTVLWNVVPWVIHQPGQRNRAPTRAETASGLALLPGLLDHLPHLAVAVLAGRAASLAQPVLAAHRPELAILRMPHPSPTYVNTAPSIAGTIEATLADAAARCRDTPPTSREPTASL